MLMDWKQTPQPHAVSFGTHLHIIEGHEHRKAGQVVTLATRAGGSAGVQASAASLRPVSAAIDSLPEGTNDLDIRSEVLEGNSNQSLLDEVWLDNLVPPHYTMPKMNCVL